MSDLLLIKEEETIELPILDYSKQKVQKGSYIDATSDLSAVKKWLDQYMYSENTYKYYRKESRRLLIWCSFELGKYLDDLYPEDMLCYFEFLKSPPKKWISNKSNIRTGSSLPFCDGGLNESSFNASIRAINSLFNYLVSAKYIKFNPLKLVKSHKSFSLDNNARKFEVKSRMLNDKEWSTFIEVLYDYPESTWREKLIKYRTLFVVSMMYFLGVRINELTTHTWNSFREENNKWWFFVEGKGRKKGSIPVSSELLNIISKYRNFIGKPSLPKPNETDFLLCNNGKPLSNRTVHKIVKDLAIKTSLVFTKENPSHVKLKSLSPHWLRHLSASHQDRLGIPATMIRDNHRHSSFQTTQIYLHTEDDARHEQIQKMSMPIQKLQKENISSSILTVNIKDSWGKEKLVSNFYRAIENILSSKIIYSGFTKNNNKLNSEKFYRVINFMEKDLSVISKEADYRLLKISSTIA